MADKLHVILRLCFDSFVAERGVSSTDTTGIQADIETSTELLLLYLPFVVIVYVIELRYSEPHLDSWHIRNE